MDQSDSEAPVDSYSPRLNFLEVVLFVECVEVVVTWRQVCWNFWLFCVLLMTLPTPHHASPRLTVLMCCGCEKMRIFPPVCFGLAGPCVSWLQHIWHWNLWSTELDIQITQNFSTWTREKVWHADSPSLDPFQSTSVFQLWKNCHTKER